jgi:hypothetical protein
MMDKLTHFKVNSRVEKVTFVETQAVKEGVDCDIYSFDSDASKDLAVVCVQPGFKTPLQKVLLGDKTIEGFMNGAGILSTWAVDGLQRNYSFDEENKSEEVSVKIGEMMQWSADQDLGLTFYEICEPPYEDGRFENVTT